METQSKQRQCGRIKQQEDEEQKTNRNGVEKMLCGMESVIYQPAMAKYICMEYWIFYRVVTSSAGHFFPQSELANHGADNNNNNRTDDEDDDDVVDDKNESVLRAD